MLQIVQIVVERWREDPSTWWKNKLSYKMQQNVDKIVQDNILFLLEKAQKWDYQEAVLLLDIDILHAKIIEQWGVKSIWGSWLNRWYWWVHQNK